MFMGRLEDGARRWPLVVGPLSNDICAPCRLRRLTCHVPLIVPVTPFLTILCACTMPSISALRYGRAQPQPRKASREQRDERGDGGPVCPLLSVPVSSPSGAAQGLLLTECLALAHVRPSGITSCRRSVGGAEWRHGSGLRYMERGRGR